MEDLKRIINRILTYTTGTDRIELLKTALENKSIYNYVKNNLSTLINSIEPYNYANAKKLEELLSFMDEKDIGDILYNIKDEILKKVGIIKFVQISKKFTILK